MTSQLQDFIRFPEAELVFHPERTSDRDIHPLRGLAKFGPYSRSMMQSPPSTPASGARERRSSAFGREAGVGTVTSKAAGRLGFGQPRSPRGTVRRSASPEVGSAPGGGCEIAANLQRAGANMRKSRLPPDTSHCFVMQL